MREFIDIAPFLAWFDEHVAHTANAAMGYDLVDRGVAIEEAERDMRYRVGWNTDAGTRRLYRYRTGDSHQGERALIQDALDHAGVSIGDLYPHLAEDVHLEPSGPCFPCREVVTPIDGKCPWCDGPVEAVEAVDLPPRPVDSEREQPTLPAPRWTARKVPLKWRGMQRLLDADLDARHVMLVAFVVTGKWSCAADVCPPFTFSSRSSAHHALRNLAKREGWLDETDGSRVGWQARTARARGRVAMALLYGTWDHVQDMMESSPGQRRIVDDELMESARKLYTERGLSFRECAIRLLPQSGTDKVSSLQSALCQEFDRRGWPRRTSAAAVKYTPPKAATRCTGLTRAGERCKRYAQAGQKLCIAHDPTLDEERVALATKASRAASADAVDVRPFSVWLLARADELGSIRAVHRRIGGVVAYDTLADWTARHGGQVRQRRVRRSTVDRILCAWGEGVTFEDIYRPVMEVAA